MNRDSRIARSEQRMRLLEEEVIALRLDKKRLEETKMVVVHSVVPDGEGRLRLTGRVGDEEVACVVPIPEEGLPASAVSVLLQGAALVKVATERGVSAAQKQATLGTIEKYFGKGVASEEPSR